MAHTNEHIGTAKELTPFLAQHPNQLFRLIELSPDGEEQQQESNNTEASKAIPAIDAENAAASALLRYYLETEATNDPEEIRQAEQELEEFKRNMNANRASTGERLVFP